jgi:hypothetical protein
MAGSAISSKMATIIVVVPLLILVWFLAPLALPVWRWQNMNDFKELSKKFNIPEKELSQVYEVQVRYKPRGPNDPCPWQLITMSPTWYSVNDQKHDDEDHQLIRVTLASDRDGKGPSKLFLGSNSYKDTYWHGKAWRFPKGAFGFNRSRVVIVYQGGEFDKLSIGDAQVLDFDLGGQGSGKWTNDDNEPDGFQGSGAAN